MCSESKDEIQPCYYYPLLARHISDNNLDGKAIALDYTFTVNEALINYSCKEKKPNPLIYQNIHQNILCSCSFLGFMATWKQMLENGIPMTNIS